MNTVKDLRQALSEEVRRLQPPVGLETRVLQQAFRGSTGIIPGPGAGRRGVGRSWESRRTEPLRAGIRALGILAAVLIVVLIVVGVLVGGRMLRDRSTVPAHPSDQAIGRAESGMVSPTAGWGSHGGWPLERTTDGGVHWVNVTPPSYVDGSDAGRYFLDATHAWITETVADSGPQKVITYRTANGGKTWDVGAAISAGGVGQLGPRLYFLDPMHGWLLFQVETIDAVGSLVVTAFMYVTKDGGLHWTLLATKAQRDPSGCGWGTTAFASLSDGWLSLNCTSPNTTQPLLVTHDGGITWLPQQLPLAEADVACPCTVDAPTIFDEENAAVLIRGSGPGYGQRLFVTADRGNSWSPRTLPGEYQLVVDFIDAKHGWAVAGSSALFAKTESGFPNLPGVPLPLYRTDDGGLTWVPIPTNLPLTSDAGRVFGVYFVDLSNGFADRFSVVTQRGQFLKTIDGGKTWTVVGPEG